MAVVVGCVFLYRVAACRLSLGIVRLRDEAFERSRTQRHNSLEGLTRDHRKGNVSAKLAKTNDGNASSACVPERIRQCRRAQQPLPICSRCAFTASREFQMYIYRRMVSSAGSCWSASPGGRLCNLNARAAKSQTDSTPSADVPSLSFQLERCAHEARIVILQQ